MTIQQYQYEAIATGGFSLIIFILSGLQLYWHRASAPTAFGWFRPSNLLPASWRRGGACRRDCSECRFTACCATPQSDDLYSPDGPTRRRARNLSAGACGVCGACGFFCCRSGTNLVGRATVDGSGNVITDSAASIPTVANITAAGGGVGGRVGASAAAQQNAADDEAAAAAGFGGGPIGPTTRSGGTRADRYRRLIPLKTHFNRLVMCRGFLGMAMSVDLRSAFGIYPPIVPRLIQSINTGLLSIAFAFYLQHSLRALYIRSGKPVPNNMFSVLGLSLFGVSSHVIGTILTNTLDRSIYASIALVIQLVIFWIEAGIACVWWWSMHNFVNNAIEIVDRHTLAQHKQLQMAQLAKVQHRQLQAQQRANANANANAAAAAATAAPIEIGGASPLAHTTVIVGGASPAVVAADAVAVAAASPPPAGRARHSPATGVADAVVQLSKSAPEPLVQLPPSPQPPNGTLSPLLDVPIAMPPTGGGGSGGSGGAATPLLPTGPPSPPIQSPPQPTFALLSPQQQTQAVAPGSPGQSPFTTVLPATTPKQLQALNGIDVFGIRTELRRVGCWVAVVVVGYALLTGVGFSVSNLGAFAPANPATPTIRVTDPDTLPYTARPFYSEIPVALVYLMILWMAWTPAKHARTRKSGDGSTSLPLNGDVPIAVARAAAAAPGGVPPLPAGAPLPLPLHRIQRPNAAAAFDSDSARAGALKRNPFVGAAAGGGVGARDRLTDSALGNLGQPLPAHTGEVKRPTGGGRVIAGGLLQPHRRDPDAVDTATVPTQYVDDGDEHALGFYGTEPVQPKGTTPVLNASNAAVAIAAASGMSQNHTADPPRKLRPRQNGAGAIPRGVTPSSAQPLPSAAVQRPPPTPAVVVVERHTTNAPTHPAVPPPAMVQGSMNQTASSAGFVASDRDRGLTDSGAVHMRMHTPGGISNAQTGAGAGSSGAGGGNRDSGGPAPVPVLVEGSPTTNAYFRTIRLPHVGGGDGGGADDANRLLLASNAGDAGAGGGGGGVSTLASERYMMPAGTIEGSLVTAAGTQTSANIFRVFAGGGGNGQQMHQMVAGGGVGAAYGAGGGGGGAGGGTDPVSGFSPQLPPLRNLPSELKNALARYS